MSRSHYYAYPPPTRAHPAAHNPSYHNYLGMSLANAPVLYISRPMPQQPMPPVVGRPRQPKQLRTPDRRKRYGMIFNTDPLGGMADDEDDDSTWSMSRSRALQWTRTQQRRQHSARTRNSSPAQEIAARYRASHSSNDRSPTSSSSVTYLQVPSVHGYSSGTRSRTTSGETTLTEQSGPRLRYRDSRANAMDRATKEAYLMAVQAGGYRNIPCQRPGCRGVLPTIRDLASHLAIHDLDPRRTSYAAHAARPPYHSFMDMGHSVEGRRRRRPFRSLAPYARTGRSYSTKLRRYLAKLTSPCMPYYDDDDYF
ncbi:hypothetical protein C8Q76DRAFT_149630 [Earliella scabrosa]|nr:hypothetical protein C8Q76DRAFT_149630 [Earliella scabrosa]